MASQGATNQLPAAPLGKREISDMFFICELVLHLGNWQSVHARCWPAIPAMVASFSETCSVYVRKDFKTRGCGGGPDGEPPFTVGLHAEDKSRSLTLMR